MSQEQEDHGAAIAHEHGGHRRSSHWNHVRDQFLKTHAKCAGCGGAEHLEAHHIVPFHICIEVDRGYAELDVRNLITLCRGPKNCHLMLGHYDDFKSFNLSVRTMLAHFQALVDQVAIKADDTWQSHHLHRPRPWDYHTTPHEKEAIKKFIDRHFPVVGEGGKVPA